MKTYEVPIKWVTQGYAVVEADTLKGAADVVGRDFPAVPHRATGKSLLEVHYDLINKTKEENQ